jgi:hypothetical protein
MKSFLLQNRRGRCVEHLRCPSALALAPIFLPLIFLPFEPCYV